MTAKELIDEIIDLRNKVSALEKLIKFYDDKSLSIPGQDFTEERVDKSRNFEAPFVKWIYKKIECEEKKERISHVLDEKLYSLSNIIEEIDNDEYKAILIGRYVVFMEWEEIAKQLSYSVGTVYKKHRQAFAELERIVK